MKYVIFFFPFSFLNTQKKVYQAQINICKFFLDLKTEGLFRKTGNVSRQRLLKEWLNEGVELCLDQETFTPHDCATVLKNYLSELPDPLLTERHYQAHLQVVGEGN